jgi:hypothetical protein
MGLYSKGTRSKGVTRQFQKAGQANTLQRSKHTKKEAFLAKEAFMKEAMARHLAAAERAADAATRPGGDDATDRGADAARDVDVGASDRAGAAPGATTPASAAAPTAARVAGAPAAAPAPTPSGKLRAKMATHPDVPMPGALRYEGKKRKASGSGDGAEGDRGVRRASSGGIGHLMKPLRGDEIDFACRVDTNAKLPKYARGKQTAAKKRKKNKRANARAKHLGE